MNERVTNYTRKGVKTLSVAIIASSSLALPSEIHDAATDDLSVRNVLDIGGSVFAIYVGANFYRRSNQWFPKQVKFDDGIIEGEYRVIETPRLSAPQLPGPESESFPSSQDS